MILSKDELLLKLKDRIGEDTTDETIAFIEDFTDTVNDYETKLADQIDWKSKYEQNNEEWKKKYKERFFNSEVKEDPVPDDGDGDGEKKTLTYDELFKED